MCYIPKTLLITPPLTQLNTPYPATAYLKGFLKQHSFPVYQADLGIELVLEIFSAKELTRIFEQVNTGNFELSENAQHIHALKNTYIQTVDDVIKYLQSKNETLAHRICSRNFLPEASRFAQLADEEWAFGTMGIRDKARYLATLYIEDLGDLIRETISPNFEFTKYAEQLSRSAASFDELENHLQKESDFVDKIMLELLKKHIDNYNPDIIGFSVPFPGNLYGALRCAQFIKTNYPNIHIIMGGGYPTTELRELSDIQVFKYVDYITLDDGEAPIIQIINYLSNKTDKENLLRTFILDQQKVKYINNIDIKDIPHKDVGTPDYSDLLLDKYLSVIEVANPMHRLWSDGRWNKLTLAHGCYWHRCTFCDTSLDYIKRYDATQINTIVDRIEEVIKQTGETGFHFVDEAAPPALLAELAIELIRRKLNISWWTNIRFEAGFTADLAKLIAASGCIAVSGGIEVASDRLLKLINKGVNLKTVSKSTRSFRDADIMVHAYLMYGFPTQTEQETIDSLEVVRQLFEYELINSAYWHLFTTTIHSPVGKNPDKFHIKLPEGQKGTFANNDLIHIDKTTDHEKFGKGLNKAVYNFMHDIGFDFQMQEWFDFNIQETTVDMQLIESYLQIAEKTDSEKLNYKVVYIGELPVLKKLKKKSQLTFHTKNEIIKIRDEETIIQWLFQLIKSLKENTSKIKLIDLSADFEEKTERPFILFLQSSTWKKLRETGLLLTK
ncbi:MAG: radical SAM protein [Bacteroidetes bacterium]|nr:MAG: radical SAM protein [Bacteroidota bacterium]